MKSVSISPSTPQGSAVWLSLLQNVVHLAEEDTLIMTSEEFSSLALSLDVSCEVVTEDTVADL